MADDIVGEGSVVITIDDAQADAAVNDLADRIERVLARAGEAGGARAARAISRAIRRISPLKVRVEADLRPFEHSLNTLNNLGNVPLPVVPDVDRARFEAAIEAALDGLEVSVRVVPDLDGFDAAIRAHNAPDVTVNVDVDRGGLGRFGRAVGALGRGLAGLGRLAGSALKIGAIGIAAAGAAQGVLALGAALAPLAGALAAGPAVALGFAAASNTLKLALSGVGDAFKAGLTGDAKAFEEALKGLSPAAQGAAKEVRALKPQFDKLKSTVQDAFFTPLEGQITKTAKALGGPLKTGMTDISAEFGKAAREALKFGQSAAAIDGLKSVFAGTKGALSGLSTATQPILKGFLDVAAAVSDAFGSKVGSALGDAAARFGTFLSTAAASGQAVAWVDGAVAVFKQLGGILSNVGSILSNVFSAANASGGGLLNNLQTITQSFKEFTASAEGQTAIGNIFGALAQAAAQLGPILSAVVSQLGAIAPAIGPLFAAIGPAIVDTVNALGPALQGILPGLQALVGGLSEGISQIANSGAFEALGQAIGAIATAAAPLLPVIGTLVGALVSALAPAVTAVAEALTPVIEAFSSAFLPVIGPVTDAITTLVTALTPIVTLIGTTLAQVISAVAPLLGTIAGLFAQIAEAVAPLIEQIGTALAPIFAQLAPIISQIVAAITPLITQLVAALLPVLPPLVDAFLAILDALLPLLPVVAELVVAVAGLATALLPIIAPIIQFGAEIIKWLAINVVVPVIQSVVDVLSSIISTVTNVITAVSGFVTTVVGFFSNFSSNVSSIVSGLVSAVTGFFSGLWSTVKGLVSSGISAVVGFFAGLPGRAVSAVSGIVGSISGVFNNLKSAVLQRVSSMISTAVTTIAGFIGKAKGALSGAASALVSAGRDLIKGMISGVKSMAGSLVSAAKDVVGGAVDGAKSLLGINSPSRVFMEIGKFTGQGFVKGLLGEASNIKQTADKLVGLITKAFKGKNTKLDDTLIKSVRNTQKQLESLAKQRDAIAEKIKKANEFAAQTTQQALQAFSLQSLAQGGAKGVVQLTDGIDAAVTQIKTFNRQVNDLAKRGLRKDLLSQIISLGPEQGAALATQLSKASDTQLDDLNEAQKQLAAASKKLGKDSADNLFDAGKQASKGFLAGLKAQQKDVEDLMLQLAKGMASAIRKALGIKSPSRVFRKIGQFTMDGLNGGLASRLSAVTQTAASAANAITRPFEGSGPTAPSLALTRPSTASGAGSAGVAQGATAAGRTVNVAEGAIVIHQVSDTDDVARRALNRLVMAGGLL